MDVFSLFHAVLCLFYSLLKQAFQHRHLFNTIFLGFRGRPSIIYKALLLMCFFSVFVLCLSVSVSLFPLVLG